MGRQPVTRRGPSDDWRSEAYEFFREAGIDLGDNSDADVVSGQKTHDYSKVYEFAKDDPDFQRVASENQWRNRTSRGLPSRMCIFEFLSKTYSRWIGKNMSQADLKAVDLGAYRALHNRLQKEEMPDWLTLPRQADMKLPKPGTAEYEAIMKARDLNRERMRLMSGLRPS